MNTKIPSVKIPFNVRNIFLPEIIDINYKPSVRRIDDIESAVRNEIRKSSLRIKIKKGARIALTGGSRGTKDIVRILRTLCHEVRGLGGEPFVVSAMGSHGGGTIKGEKDVLNSIGITEKAIKAPVVVSRETAKICETEDGLSVYLDKEAYDSDGIIAVNRIKPHTDFEGEIESGIMKMLVVGLGKEKGAKEIHRFGVLGLKEKIQKIGRLVIKKAPVILGIGIIENCLRDTAVLEAIEPDRIEAREKELLKTARKMSSKLPFKKIDLLIVEEIGKEISGTGLDTNVIGRRMIFGGKEPSYPKITRIAALDLTSQSHGNAAGIGLVDIITARLYRKIDFNNFYFNTITSTFIERGKIPLVLPNDESAIKIALETAWTGGYEDARIAKIKNTLNLDKMAVSKSLFSEIKGRKDIIPTGKFYNLRFSRTGKLI